MIEHTAVARTNPLARFVSAVPDPAARALSIAGHLAGAALACYIADDQSYDPTQVMTIGVAAVALVSLLPAPRVGPSLPAFGAGVLFFSGSLLWHLSAGILMLFCGVIALAGVLLLSRRSPNALTAAIVSFFVAAPLTAAAVVLIIATVDG
jgi:hypothetical protein